MMSPLKNMFSIISVYGSLRVGEGSSGHNCISVHLLIQQQTNKDIKGLKEPLQQPPNPPTHHSAH